MFGGKVSGYQLTIEAMLDATSDDNGKVPLSCVSSESCVLSILLSTLHYTNEAHVSIHIENSVT